MSKQSFSKPALSLEDQVALLQSRGLIVPDVALARETLLRLNYYRFSGYALHFEIFKDRERTHQFKPGTNFADVLALYDFDTQLRALLFRYIEPIEVAFRTAVAHELAMRTKDPHWYLDKSHYDARFDYDRMMLECQSEYDRSDEVFIQHYREKYDTPPLPPAWMLSEVLSMGRWSKLYFHLHNTEVKRAIARHFSTDPHYLQSWIHALSVLRNLCAHHCRIWNRTFKFSPKLPQALKNRVAQHNRLAAMHVVLMQLLQPLGKAPNFQQDWYALMAAFPMVPEDKMGFPPPHAVRSATMITGLKNIPEYKLLLLSECIDVAEALDLGWVFRGQANADWDIASSLEREAKRFKNTSPWESETLALEQVKRTTTCPESLQLAGSDDFSWLSFLQHHGCKTRLVDFTESFYFALFFALRDLPAECEDGTEQDAAIWAIKKTRLDAGVEVVAQKHDWHDRPEELAHRFINNAIELHWRYDEAEEPALAVVACKPAKLNPRLIAQQGLFLAPLNLKYSFAENLSRCLGLEEVTVGAKKYESVDDLTAAEPGLSVLKIVIPASEHRKLLFHLRRMNITEATLFPGLDGFARSLNYYAIGMELAP